MDLKAKNRQERGEVTLQFRCERGGQPGWCWDKFSKTGPNWSGKYSEFRGVSWPQPRGDIVTTNPPIPLRTPFEVSCPHQSRLSSYRKIVLSGKMCVTQIEVVEVRRPMLTVCFSLALMYTGLTCELPRRLRVVS
jgi:hypothetical protein